MVPASLRNRRGMSFTFISPPEPESNRKLAYLGLAILLYVGVLLLPTPAGLTAIVGG